MGCGSPSRRHVERDRSSRKERNRLNDRRYDRSPAHKGDRFPRFERNNQQVTKVEKRAIPRKERDATVFTLLKKTSSQILNVLKHRLGYRNPDKLNVPADKKNTYNFCAYHEETGHTTEDCFNF